MYFGASIPVEVIAVTELRVVLAPRVQSALFGLARRRTPNRDIILTPAAFLPLAAQPVRHSTPVTQSV